MQSSTIPTYTTSEASITHYTSTLQSGAVFHHWPVERPKAAVIFQHGYGEYAEQYLESNSCLIRELIGRNFDVWALDMWGHGQSPGIPRGVCHVGKVVDDHIQLRQHVADTQKQSLPVFLFGHSVGGLVTACSVLRGPAALLQHTEGVVLEAPALLDPVGTLALRLFGMVAACVPSRPMSSKPSPVQDICRDPEYHRKWLADPMVAHGQLSFRLAATALQESEGMWRNLTEWRVPVLVCHGTADTYTDSKQSPKFINGLKVEDKTLYLVDGGYHNLLADLDRERTLGVMMKWLEQRYVKQNTVDSTGKNGQNLLPVD